jgi:enterochelin esterase-like enzyme
MDHRKLAVPIAAIALAVTLLASPAIAQPPAAPAAGRGAQATPAAAPQPGAAPAAAPSQAPAAGRAGRGAQATPAAAPQPGAAPAAAPSPAPAAGRGGRGAQAPAVVSPEVLSDGRITFRIRAPQAESVQLSASDIPALAGGGRGAAPSGRAPGALTRLEDGIWSVTVGPVDPGAYRYKFAVDGVLVVDPVNPLISESNAYTSSMVVVPGSDFQDAKQVPHGAIAAVTYYSSVLKTFRRMRVYTPPGYELGGQKFPVFYLLHGASDCDESWTSVGRAGFILDNLLAAKKVKPMIIVMPAGHQPGQPGMGGGGGRGAAADPAAVPMFTQEFIADMMPYVESHYRTINDRAHRAIAGLSMGGGQTLDIAFRKLDRFAYIGVFSSGASLAGGGRGAAPAAGAAAQAPRPDFESLHKADLDNAGLKKGTKLVWLSTGVDDSLMSSTKATVDVLKKHGFAPVFKESPGAHTWINWRNYLHEFAPLLFQ